MGAWGMKVFIAGIVAASLWAGPALAAPRDDVLYGASRCGAHTDDRTWLDCFYGAAQPMRARLGLSAAPAAQQQLVPPVPSGGQPPVPQAMAAPRPPAAQAPKPGFFGRMITPTVEKPGEPTTLASYKFDGAGMFTVTLANGETWRQDMGDSARARWRGPAGNYKAQILPSSSSYKLLKVGSQTFLVNKR